MKLEIYFRERGGELDEMMENLLLSVPPEKALFQEEIFHAGLSRRDFSHTHKEREKKPRRSRVGRKLKLDAEFLHVVAIG